MPKSFGLLACLMWCTFPMNFLCMHFGMEWRCLEHVRSAKPPADTTRRVCFSSAWVRFCRFLARTACGLWASTRAALGDRWCAAGVAFTRAQSHIHTHAPTNTYTTRLTSIVHNVHTTLVDCWCSQLQQQHQLRCRSRTRQGHSLPV